MGGKKEEKRKTEKGKEKDVRDKFLETPSYAGVQLIWIRKQHLHSLNYDGTLPQTHNPSFPRLFSPLLKGDSIGTDFIFSSKNSKRNGYRLTLLLFGQDEWKGFASRPMCNFCELDSLLRYSGFALMHFVSRMIRQNAT